MVGWEAEGKAKILVWFRRKIRNNFVYQRKNTYSQEIKKNQNTGSEKENNESNLDTIQGTVKQALRV